MEVGDTKPSSRYRKPPWIFKGSALYQLHLVKAETARAFIPKEFRLVEAFGYTLGGFFLASYDDSPAGTFDELVVIAGLVWNPPTSCAPVHSPEITILDSSTLWAARVLVNSDEACAHGRKEIGLPSQVAKFSKRITAVPNQRQGKISGPLNMIGIGTTFSSPKDSMDIQVTENRSSGAADIFNIRLMTAVPESKTDKWMGPAIKISLPSFSGCTEYNPNLLKYSCKIECRVRAVKPAKVYGSSSAPKNDRVQSSEEQRMNSLDSRTGEIIADDQNLCVSVMLSKPVLALEFSCLRMQVEAPVVVSHFSNVSLKDS